MENERKQSVQTRIEAETSSPDDTVTAATPVPSSASGQPSAPDASGAPLPHSAEAVSGPRPADTADTSDTSDTSETAQAQVEPTDASALNGASATATHSEPPVPIAEVPEPAAANGQANRDLPDPAQPASWHAPAGARPAQSFSPVSPGSPVLPPPGAGFLLPRNPAPMPSHVPWEAASSWGATTLTVQANTAAGASYLFWWVSGMLIYFNERHNRFVRFHAMQSILLTGALTVFSVLAYILSSLCGDMYQATGLHAYRTLGTGIAALAVVLVVIPWFLAMIAAWSGNYMRLPIVGTYAERYAAPPLHPPTVY